MNKIVISLILFLLMMTPAFAEIDGLFGIDTYLTSLPAREKLASPAGAPMLQVSLV